MSHRPTFLFFAATELLKITGTGFYTRETKMLFCDNPTSWLPSLYISSNSLTLATLNTSTLNTCTEAILPFKMDATTFKGTSTRIDWAFRRFIVTKDDLVCQRFVASNILVGNNYRRTVRFGVPLATEIIQRCQIWELFSCKALNIVGLLLSF